MKQKRDCKHKRKKLTFIVRKTLLLGKTLKSRDFENKIKETTTKVIRSEKKLDWFLDYIIGIILEYSVEEQV